MSEFSRDCRDLETLIATAAATPLARPQIAALASAAPIAQLTAALSEALAQARVHAATSLALAVGTAGGRLPAPLALQLMPDVDSMKLVPVIAGIIEGDRLNALLDLVDEQQVSWEREALALYLATQLLSGAEPPPRLLSRLRNLGSDPLSPEAGMLAGLAARALGGSALEAVDGLYLSMAAGTQCAGVEDDLRALLTAPVLESLPERAERLVTGYTVIRSEPKVGRNDPCPCGSGRKYKKCCGARDTEAPVPPSASEQFQKLKARGGRGLARVLYDMRPGELARLDPEEIPTPNLIHAVRKLTDHRRWEPVERFLDVLSTRTDTPGGDPADYRLEVADQALEAGNLELAERQAARANLAPEEKRVMDAKLAVARNTPDALSLLEAALAAGHEGDRNALIDGTYTLLHHFPALGILAARGCLDPERLLDSEMLLEEIDRARQRLGLPPDETWWEIFDSMSPGDPGPRHRPVESGDDAGERQRQIDSLRAELAAAKQRSSRLDNELKDRVHRLEALTGEREKLASMLEAAQGKDERQRVSELEEERQRLRKKIEELKGEIREGTAQRADLRRELSHATATQREQSPPLAQPERGDETDAGEFEGETAAGEHARRVLVPHFSTAGERALTALPARVAGDGLQQIALLASGEPRAWSGVKHLRRAHEVLSSRIGRSYRLLFRLSDDRLEVIDFVHRQDLDAAVQRLTGR